METKYKKIEKTQDKLWKQFKVIFWSLFLFHIAIKALPSAAQTEESYATLALVSIVLNIVVALEMAMNVGYHTYKFSGGQIYLLKGLLGLFWFAIIGIFIAFAVVQNDYYKVSGKSLKSFSLFRERASKTDDSPLL